MPSQRLLTKDDYYFPFGVFLEGAFWGVYTVLFIAALWIWGKRRSQDGTPTSTFSRWLYLVLITLMWFVASVHLGTSIHRLLRIYVLEIEVGKKPHQRIQDPMKWDNMAHSLLIAIMMWLGDVLVIFRTYIVWNRSIRVVALPVIVHIACMVANIICIYGFGHPDRIPRKITFAWSLPVFPLAFAQNIITTALLTYKTYSTHRMSCNNGATNATPGVVRLGSLSRILIETAMLYTMGLLVMIVLGTIRHPATTIASMLLVPTLGIVFVLLSVRVHFSGTPTTHDPSMPSKVPNMFRDSVSDDGAGAALAFINSCTAPRQPPSPDGDVSLQRHDSDNEDGAEDKQSELLPVSISQMGSQIWL